MSLILPSIPILLPGPIRMNPMLSPASDPVTASALGLKPVDRSKGLWTRCEKCGVILYIKHLREHDHICFGCNYHLKMSSQVSQTQWLMLGQKCGGESGRHE